eukprot:1404182-Pyramimonas_sp.AAC.1
MGVLLDRSIAPPCAASSDDLRPDCLQILGDMDVPDPHDASDSQLIEASTKRGLDGLKQHRMGKLVKRSEAAGKGMSARWDHVYKWDAKLGCRIAKSRGVAREFKWQ